MMFAPLLLLPATPASVSGSQTPASPTTPSLLAPDTNAQGIPGLFASLLSLHTQTTPKSGFPILLPEQESREMSPEPAKKGWNDPFIQGTLAIETLYVLQASPAILPTPPAPEKITDSETSSQNSTETLPVSLPSVPATAVSAMVTASPPNQSSLPLVPQSALETSTPSLFARTNLPASGDLAKTSEGVTHKDFRSSLNEVPMPLGAPFGKQDISVLDEKDAANTLLKANLSDDKKVVVSDQSLPVGEVQKFTPATGTEIPVDFKLEASQPSTFQPTPLPNTSPTAKIQPDVKKPTPTKSSVSSSPDLPRFNERGEVIQNISSSTEMINLDVEMGQPQQPESTDLRYPEPPQSRPEVNSQDIQTALDKSSIFIAKSEETPSNGQLSVSRATHSQVDVSEIDVELKEIPTSQITSSPTTPRPSMKPLESAPDLSSFNSAPEPVRLNNRGEVDGDIPSSSSMSGFDGEMIQMPTPHPTPNPANLRPAVTQSASEGISDELSVLVMQEDPHMNERGEVAEFVHTLEGANNLETEKAQTRAAQPSRDFTNPRPVENFVGNEITPKQSEVNTAFEPVQRDSGEASLSSTAVTENAEGGLKLKQSLTSKVGVFPETPEATVPLPSEKLTLKQSDLATTSEPERLSKRDGNVTFATTDNVEVASKQTSAAQNTSVLETFSPAINQLGDEEIKSESSLPSSSEPVRLSKGGFLAQDVHVPADNIEPDVEIKAIPGDPVSHSSVLHSVPSQSAENLPDYQTTTTGSGISGMPDVSHLNASGQSAETIQPLANQTIFEGEKTDISSPNDEHISLKPADKKEALPTQATPENVSPSRVEASFKLPTTKEALPPSFVAQISQATEELVKTKHTTLHLQLAPEALGPIDLQLTSGTNGTRVTLVTHMSDTGNLLTHHLEDLRASLAQAGVSVNGLVVQYQASGGQSGWARAWYQPPATSSSPQVFSEKEALSESDELTPQPQNVSGLDYRI